MILQSSYQLAILLADLVNKEVLPYLPAVLVLRQHRSRVGEVVRIFLAVRKLTLNSVRGRISWLQGTIMCLERSASGSRKGLSDPITAPPKISPL